MRFFPALVVAAALILPSAAAEGDQPQAGEGGAQPAQVVELAITDVFRPAFAAFAEEAGALESDIAELCQDPAAEVLASAQAQFRATIAAWSRIELFRLGPLTTENRSESILFWPDRKGIALRQVQAALADEDASATSAAALSAKSVAMQGLGALEYLLFGTDFEALASPVGAYRCSYAEAISHLLSARGATMSAEWADPAGISQRLLEPSQTDPDYRSTREVLEALVGLLAHGTEAIRDQRLLPFLGRDGTVPKPRSAMFWRSGMTVPAIAGNFDSLETLLVRSRLAEATDAENLWVGDSAGFEFRNVARAVALITDPVEAALADPRQRQALDYLVIVSQSLTGLFGESLSAALGLSVGFSSLDGD